MPYTPLSQEEISRVLGSKAKGNPKAAWETSPLGKILRAIGTTERISTKLLAKPLAYELFPEARERLSALTGDTYAGDVLKAVIPELTLLGQAVGGTIAGAAIDPLTYVGIGGLTKPGRALAPLARAGSLAAEARKGQRALLHARVPLTNIEKPIYAGTPVFKAIDVMRSGKTARSTIGKVPGLEDGAAWLDSFWRAVGKHLGFQALDPWIHMREKAWFQAIAGSNRLRRESIIDPILPVTKSLIDDLTELSGRPQNEVKDAVGAVLSDLRETHAWMFERAPGTKRFGIKRYKDLGEADIDRQQILDTIDKHWPTHPSFGGPGYALEPSWMRKAREAAIAERRASWNITKEQEDQLKDFAHLWSDSEYFRRVLTDDFTKELNHGVLTTKYVALGKTGRPTAKLAENMMRRFRIVHPDGVAEVQDIIKDPIRIKVTKTDALGRKHRRLVKFNLLASLNKHAGRPVTSSEFKAIKAFQEAGKLNADQIGKLIPTPTPSQMNEWIWDFGLTLGGKQVIRPQTVKEAFSIDPFEALVKRGESADRAILGNQFWKDVTNVDEHVLRGRLPVAVPVNRLAEFSHAKNYIPVPTIPELKGYLVEPDLAKHFSTLGDVDQYVTEHMNKFFQLITRGTRYWRSWALSIFPAYHTRNAVSNMWQYYMGEHGSIGTGLRGLKDASVYMTTAGNTSKRILLRKGDDELANIFKSYNRADGTVAHWDFTKELYRRNAVGIGEITQDNKPGLDRVIRQLERGGPKTIENSVIRMYKKNGWYSKWKGLMPDYEGAAKIKHNIHEVVGTEAKWVRAGFWVGDKVDQVPRVAHILNRIREGHHFDSAVMSMKKYFYDYHDLSQTERTWAKNIFPFYTWSRKNIPFYLEAIIRDPAKLARFHDILQGWSGSDNPKEEAFMSDWMKRNFAVRSPIRRKDKNGNYEYWILKNWLSVADLQDVFHAWNFMTGSLNPVPRVLGELIANYNTFTNRQIDRMSQSIREGGLKAPFSVGERTTKYAPFTQVFGTISAKEAHVLNSIRLSKTIHDLVDNPQELDPQIKWLNLLMGRAYPLSVRYGIYDVAKTLEENQLAVKRAVRAAIHRNEPMSEIVRLYTLALKKQTKAIQGIQPQLEKP